MSSSAEKNNNKKLEGRNSFPVDLDLLMRFPPNGRYSDLGPIRLLSNSSSVEAQHWALENTVSSQKEQTVRGKICLNNLSLVSFFHETAF